MGRSRVIPGPSAGPFSHPHTTAVELLGMAGLGAALCPPRPSLDHVEGAPLQMDSPVLATQAKNQLAIALG